MICRLYFVRHKSQLSVNDDNQSLPDKVIYSSQLFKLWNLQCTFHSFIPLYFIFWYFWRMYCSNLSFIPQYLHSLILQTFFILQISRMRKVWSTKSEDREKWRIDWSKCISSKVQNTFFSPFWKSKIWRNEEYIGDALNYDWSIPTWNFLGPEHFGSIY